MLIILRNVNIYNNTTLKHYYMRVVYIFVMKFDSYTFKLNRIFYYTIKPMLYWKKTV